MKHLITLLFIAFCLCAVGQDIKKEPAYIIVYMARNPTYRLIVPGYTTSSPANNPVRRVEAFNTLEELQNRLTSKYDTESFIIHLSEINEDDLIAIYDIKNAKKIPFVYETESHFQPDKIIVDTIRGRKVIEKRFVLKEKP